MAEQGINRIPQIHLGSAVTAMMKRGVATDKGDHYRKIEEANKQIESLERSLAKVEEEINTSKKISTLSVDLAPKGQGLESRVSGIGLSKKEVIPIHFNFAKNKFH